MKEYALVRLLVDRPQYEKYGVKKGMFGAIISEKKVRDKWLVSFGMAYSGEDIADICVKEEDLEVWEHAPRKEDFVPEQIGGE